MISKKKNISVNEEYKEIVHNLDVGYFRVGLDGTILKHNPKFNEIFGISINKSLVGTKSFDFWQQSEERDKFIEELTRVGHVKNYLAHARKVTGEEIVVQGNSHLVKNENDHPIATEGTIIDISEKFILEHKLKTSEEKYRDLIEFLPDTIFETDLDLNITFVNSVGFEKFGYVKEDLDKGINIGQLIDPKYREKAYLKINEVLEGKATKPETYLIQKRDGTPIYARIHSRPIIENGSIVGMRGTLTDINDRIIAEKKLEESEEKYRMISENANDLIAVVDMNLSYEYINKGYELLGYTKEEIYNTSAPDLIHPDDVNRAVAAFMKGKETGTGSEELRIRRKDGTYSWFEVQGQLFKDRNEEQKALLISRNITERKNFEEQLRESESKYRSLFENMNAGFAYHEVVVNEINQPIDYIYHEVNPAFEKLTGMKREDLIGKRVTKAIPGTENDPADWIGKFGNVGLTGVPLTVEDYSEAIDRWFKVSGYSPKKGFFAVTFTDITERKKAEQDLIESELKFSTIAEQSLLGIAILQNDKFKYVNQRFAEMGDRTVEEISNWGPREFLEMVHPDDRSIVIEHAKNRQLGLDNNYSSYECRTFKKTGGLMWVQTYSRTIIFNGKSADLITTIDITDRKLAEQELINSEEKYRKLFENSPIALMEQDFSDTKKYINQLRTSGVQDFEKFFEDYPKEALKCMVKVKIIDVNKKTLEIYKVESKEDYIFKMNRPQNILENNMPEEIFLDNKKELLALINGETVYESEVASKTHDGIDLHLYAKTSIVPGFEKTWSKVILSIVDITDRKLTEQKLRASEEKFYHLYESSPYAILLINMRGDIVDCNLSTEKLLGFNKNELIGKRFQEAVFIPKQHISLTMEDFNTLLKGKKIESKEVQLYTKSRDLKWVSYQASTFFIEKEMIIQLSIQDIEARKNAEKELIDSEEKYHNLFETSPNIIILADPRGTIVECNSAVETISGYSQDEFIGKNFIELEIYQEGGLKTLSEGFMDLFGDSKLEYVDLPINHKDHRTIWIRIIASLITLRGQNFILVIIHDITTQKIAEEALKRSEEQYRDLLETSSIGVLEYDMLNNKLTYINPKLLEIIGYEKGELNEEIFINKLIYHKDLQKLIRTNEEADLEFRIFDKQGKLKWLSGKRIPNYGDNNEIIGIRVWLDDITEKKMYEELIYELNVNFLNFTTDIRTNIELLLNTAMKLLGGDYIIYAHKNHYEGENQYQIITSDNETYLFEPKQFKEQLLLSEILIEGHDFPQIFYDIDDVSFAQSDPFIKKVSAKGAFGKLIKSQEGFDNLICVLYKNNPIITGQDKLVLFLISDAIEIEQRRWQVQQDLEKQNITLNKINKLKTELFSRTSHELKTPLISIKGFTELLLTLHKSKLDTETISILEEIKDGSKRLEKIINLLLESTKLEAGQLALKKSKEDLTFLINFCVKELKGLARLRNQTIIFDMDDTIEAFFDKERIYEVISNLLLNAVKYTPPGGEISIRVQQDQNSYIISVKDNGIGFTEEEMENVFKQFGKIERYGQGWDVAIEGTGLGLYITKKLVELHDGKIWLESEGRNKGSTFYFSIPKSKIIS
ncbi:MAG: PAS domain S-box protein [Promethearchaeota archaeon]